ncbi:MAG: hypothetical protein SPF56_01110 [Bacteroidaceae bacterium]|nr:hypothetical protein [Prevotellaceae bacterium]MDY5631101.1 hypothetical protein [Bacteroidaceae bacterium]
MSDGNFNRALLPHTPLESGLKMGKAMARKAAQEAFREYLEQTVPTCDLEAEMLCFSRLLDKRIK